jgi:hypothetical protein
MRLARSRPAWKLNGIGGCYFDPNDTGGDQCVPAGGSDDPEDVPRK